MIAVHARRHHEHGRPPLPEVPTWIVRALERPWTPADWTRVLACADGLGVTPGEVIRRALVTTLEIAERQERGRRRDHGTRPSAARRPTAGRGRRR
jgi:hypothetical protein